jgi:hypothetical protein
MSRSISELQGWILLLCLERGGFVSSQDILCAWFGCEPEEWGSKKAAVGWDEYNKCHATLSRSISRLSQRGLVVIWKTPSRSATGISLTDEGKALARAISDEEKEDPNNG